MTPTPKRYDDMIHLMQPSELPSAPNVFKKADKRAEKMAAMKKRKSHTRILKPNSSSKTSFMHGASNETARMIIMKPQAFGNTKSQLRRLLDDAEVELASKHLSYDHSGPLLID